MENVKQSFRFSKEVDGVTKNVSGEEVENGWVITISKEWYEGEGDNRKWKNECKKYISKDNPMENLKNKDKKDKEEVSDMINSLSNISGLLSVD